MSLSILPVRSAMRPNLTLPFHGFGGTEPYVYSVQAGGVGGTIDPDTGIYTSPAGFGTDTIVVTDADAATATAPVLVGTPLLLLCDILQSELGLANGRVYIWDQKINKPADNDLWIAVSELTCKPFGNSNRLLSNGDAEQSTNFLTTASIDIISRGPAARERKEEVILALNSVYAEQQQELNGFYLATQPTAFVNLSEVDGAAIPYRFNISVGIQYSFKKTKAVAYYDDFADAEITTEP